MTGNNAVCFQIQRLVNRADLMTKRVQIAANHSLILSVGVPINNGALGGAQRWGGQSSARR